jgi:hypothetical protein
VTGSDVSATYNDVAHNTTLKATYRKEYAHSSSYSHLVRRVPRTLSYTVRS